MEPSDPQLAAAYRRIRDAQDGVEDREFRRGASKRWMRMRETGDSQMAIDEAQERLYQAVADARRLGLEWESIGDALRMTAAEAQSRYRSADPA